MLRSAALTEDLNERLRRHLLRADGDEDLTFAVWYPSRGKNRVTAVLSSLVPPHADERHVHGNASFETEYFLRAAEAARADGGGLALLHSHPLGDGWQGMSPTDEETERRFAPRSQAVTGLPFVGLTMAKGGELSARFWERADRRDYRRRDCENVRVVGSALAPCWHPELRPSPAATAAQLRTVSAWGEEVQADLARLRVGIIGAGSVGAMVGEALARTGVQDIVLLDFDTVEERNLDRLVHASALDARLWRSKVETLAKGLRGTATAAEPTITPLELSVVEQAGFAAALDCDVLFSCVDRPWPRAALNYLAMAHLIPVVDAGIRIKRTKDGRLRLASWRAHVASPGRACLECLGQFRIGDVAAERDGSLDDPEYIESLPVDHPLAQRQNVFAFSQAAAALACEQYLRMVVAPGGLTNVGAQRHQFKLGTTGLENDGCQSQCPYADIVATGDGSLDDFMPTGAHRHADHVRETRRIQQRRTSVRIRRWADECLHSIRAKL